MSQRESGWRRKQGPRSGYCGRPILLNGWPSVGRPTYRVTDQKPLVERNAQLPDGWEIGDLATFLIKHVFFWPRAAAGSIRHGPRLHAHYEAKRPRVVRMRTTAHFHANPEGVPLWAAFDA